MPPATAAAAVAAAASNSQLTRTNSTGSVQPTAADLETVVKLQQAAATAAATSSLRRATSASSQRKRSFDAVQSPKNSPSKRPSTSASTPKSSDGNSRDNTPKSKSSPSKTPGTASTAKPPAPSLPVDLDSKETHLLGGIARRPGTTPAESSTQELQAREALEVLAQSVATPKAPPIDAPTLQQPVLQEDEKKVAAQPNAKQPPTMESLTEAAASNDDDAAAAASEASGATPAVDMTAAPVGIVESPTSMKSKFEDLLKAAAGDGDDVASDPVDQKREAVIATIVALKHSVKDLGDDDDGDGKAKKDGDSNDDDDDSDGSDVEKAVKVPDEVEEIGSYKSVIPQLSKEPAYKDWEDQPPEPDLEDGDNYNYRGKGLSSDKSSHRPNGKLSKGLASSSSSLLGSHKKLLSSTSGKFPGLSIGKADYPYQVDPWWPSSSAIRKERRARGEPTDGEDVTEAPSLSNESSKFTVDLQSVQHRLANELEPGVLEKVPHCRIHRLAMQNQKSATIPDHAFCWQVTENYATEPMVCCSICGTWRHAACGGHYKPYTVRDSIETPFVPVCDRCHAEKAILRDYPRAEQKLERQRIEQIRRALATSAVIRQAAFAKHGGTYKWPLGSTSATHIAGHTRSVHSRHDKADKHWGDMVLRLNGQPVKGREKSRVKTREFERLLVAVEDAGEFSCVCSDRSPD